MEKVFCWKNFCPSQVSRAPGCSRGSVRTLIAAHKYFWKRAPSVALSFEK